MRNSRARWIVATLAGVCLAAGTLGWLLYRRIGATSQPRRAMQPTMLAAPAAKPPAAATPTGRGGVAPAGFGGGVGVRRPVPPRADQTQAAAQAAYAAARRQFEKAEQRRQGSSGAAPPLPGSALEPEGSAMSGGVYPGAGGMPGTEYIPPPALLEPAPAPPAPPPAPHSMPGAPLPEGAKPNEPAPPRAGQTQAAAQAAYAAARRQFEKAEQSAMGSRQSPPNGGAEAGPTSGGAAPPVPMVGAPAREGAKPAAPSAAAILAQLGHGLPAGDATRGIVLAKPPAAAAPIQLKRYPAIEAPNRVAPATRFSVMVSLDVARLAPQTRILQGAATAAGQLKLNLPANAAQQWTIDVVLILPGTLQVAGNGSNSAHLVLPERGDSTPAMFRLEAPPQQPGAPASHSEPIMATLWYKGTFLARIERDITVAAPGAALAAAPGTATAAAPPPVALDFTARRPDLTLLVMKNDAGTGFNLVINSPYLQPALYQVPKPRGLRAWLAAQYALLAARSSRSFGAPAAAAGAAQANAAFLDGFGRQLYRTYAPAPFRQAFWTLESKLGSRFHTIEILTDDPTLPWELMRPIRPGGGGELNFLGLDFDIARWDLSQSPGALQRPPQREALDTVDVLAPNYTASLPGQRSELAALEALGAHRIAPADLASVRRLLAAPPQGIIHFAGHGGVAAAGGATQYGILLHGGVLDLMTLRGLEPLASPAAHPLVFFNACEVGQDSSAPGFVDGWAPELLRDGASGYIGALWAVNDAMAARFSRRFYALLEQNLARGADVGAILTQTRRELYQATGNPTALAYIFYGDPYLTFYRPH